MNWLIFGQQGICEKCKENPTPRFSPTRVPQDHSCPSRGGLVQGWESECCGVGWGIPFFTIKVSKSHSFQASKFHFSNFQSFKVPAIKNTFHVFCRYCSTSKVLKIFLDGSSGLSVPPWSFPWFFKFRIYEHMRSPKYVFFNFFVFPWIIWSGSVTPKLRIIGFGSNPADPTNMEMMGVSVSPKIIFWND